MTSSGFVSKLQDKVATAGVGGDISESVETAESCAVHCSLCGEVGDEEHAERCECRLLKCKSPGCEEYIAAKVRIATLLLDFLYHAINADRTCERT